MSDDTNQAEAADELATETDEAKATPVPNVREGARSGIDHEPLTPRKSTLVGRDSVTVSHDDGETTTTETITDEVTTTPDAQPGADEDGFGGDAPKPADPGTVEQGGGGEAENDDTGEVTQPGEALPPVEQSGGEPVGEPPVNADEQPAGEATGPEGTPIGDAAQAASGDDSSDAGAPESPASDDASSSEAPQEG